MSEGLKVGDVVHLASSSDDFIGNRECVHMTIERFGDFPTTHKAHLVWFDENGVNRLVVDQRALRKSIPKQPLVLDSKEGYSTEFIARMEELEKIDKKNQPTKRVSVVAGSIGGDDVGSD